MALDLTQHPCFNSDVRHRTGRIHLPVAPRCNIQCNYCDRKFDCANESRPGVTSSVLSPSQAVALSRSRSRKSAVPQGGRHCRPGRPVCQSGRDDGNSAPGSRKVSGDAAVRGHQRSERRALCRGAGAVASKPRHLHRQRGRSGDWSADLRLGARRARNLSQGSRREPAVGAPKTSDRGTEEQWRHCEDKHDCRARNQRHAHRGCGHRDACARRRHHELHPALSGEGHAV